MADGDLRTGTLVQRQRQWQAERQQQQRGARGRQAPWITRRPAARGGGRGLPACVPGTCGTAQRAFISKNAQGMTRRGWDRASQAAAGCARAADAVASARPR
jgi:hypothetical protein